MPPTHQACGIEVLKGVVYGVATFVYLAICIHTLTSSTTLYVLYGHGSAAYVLLSLALPATWFCIKATIKFRALCGHGFAKYPKLWYRTIVLLLWVGFVAMHIWLAVSFHRRYVIEVMEEKARAAHESGNSPQADPRGAIMFAAPLEHQN